MLCQFKSGLGYHYQKNKAQVIITWALFFSGIKEELAQDQLYLNPLLLLMKDIIMQVSLLLI